MTESELERFLQKVEIPANVLSDCWLWTAAVTGVGYGAFGRGTKKDGDKRTELAHRLMFEHFNGSLPKEAVLLHSCDVRNCVNPSHLSIGTRTDNAADRDSKQRQARGERQGSAKLNEALVREIFDASGTQQEIADRFGITDSHVCLIKNGKAWKHLNLLGH